MRLVSRKYNFLVGKRRQVTNLVLKLIRDNRSFSLLPISLNDLASVDKNPNLLANYEKINFCVTDGMPLVWLFNLSDFIRGKKPKAERVYGPHLMQNILMMGEKSTRHFFYGSSHDTINKLKNNIKNISTDTNVVGMISPPFRELTLNEEASYIIKIKKSKANVLWIGLSSPKQVVLAARWSKFFPNTAIMCMGAAFDFIAEKQTMAPSIVQKAGLEWLFRLLVDPRRLWKRYLLVIPGFILRRIYYFFFN